MHRVHGTALPNGALGTRTAPSATALHAPRNRLMPCKALLPGDPSGFLAEHLGLTQWEGLPPGFGRLAVQGAVQQGVQALRGVAAQAGHELGVPQLQATLSQKVSSVVEGPVGNKLHSLLQPVADATLAVAVQESAVQESVVGAGKHLTQDVLTGLQRVQEKITEAVTPLDLGPQAPHWGTAAAKSALESLAGWAESSLVAGKQFSSALSTSEWGQGSLSAEGLNHSAMSQLEQAGHVLASTTGALGQLSPAVVATLQPALATLATSLAGLSVALGRPLGVPGSAAAAQLLAESQTLLVSVSAALEGAVARGAWAGHDLGLLALISVVAVAGVAASAWAAGNTGGVDDYGALSYDYDPVSLAAYFERRPALVIKRATQVALEGAAFGAALLADMATGQLAANEPLRAAQLRQIIERLGPAYVKVAQALSTRVDLLSPTYFLEIQLLQDRVPPFPTSQARVAIAAAFGRPIESVCTTITDEPIAAASLGQVYRATLVPEFGGGEVAIKVQRPGVLAAVALDLFLIRQAAVALQPQLRSDWGGIVDAWAERFFQEMDYEREAGNSERFSADVADLQGIFVPKAKRELSNKTVLCTDFVPGVKLSESQDADVRELCNTLLNCCLTCLLDTGFLHADPHPGNLIRTPDGKVAVLDYGLMTEVSESQRWALLEYIAHLSCSDWPAVARDLQIMGFIPENVDPAEAGLVEPLGRIMAQLVGGGGAAKINIDRVLVELEELGKSYPLVVPPFFVLILRSFSVIEGIALGVDPDYSIVAGCFPYLARRLLSDDSPRARAVLRSVLYGGRQRLDIARLGRVATGFAAFTTDGQLDLAANPTPKLTTTTTGTTGTTGTTSRVGTVSIKATPNTSFNSTPTPSFSPAAPNSGGLALSRAIASRQQLVSQTQGSQRTGGGAPEPLLPPALQEALLLVFKPEGSYVQELLIEEAVAATDAITRNNVATAVERVVGRLAGRTTGLRGVLGAAAARLAPVVALSSDDLEALAVVQGMAQLFAQARNPGALALASPVLALPGGLAPPLTSDQVQSLVRELGPLLPRLAPGWAGAVRRFNSALATRAVQRFQQDFASMTSLSQPASASTYFPASSSYSAASLVTPTAQPVTQPVAVQQQQRGLAMAGLTATPAPVGYYPTLEGGARQGTWIASADQLLGNGARVKAISKSQQ